MSEVTTRKEMLKVLVLSKAMAKQIVICPFDMKPDSLYQQITKRLASQDMTPVGWIPAKMLGDTMGSSGERFWLIKNKAQWMWFLSPDSGPIFDLWNPTLEQLFI